MGIKQKEEDIGMKDDNDKERDFNGSNGTLRKEEFKWGQLTGLPKWAKKTHFSFFVCLLQFLG